MEKIKILFIFLIVECEYILEKIKILLFFFLYDFYYFKYF